MRQAIHFGRMTVQWNRAKPPRAMGRTEVFIRMAVYHCIYLLFCCMHPVGMLCGIMFWAADMSKDTLLSTTEASIGDIALAVELIAHREYDKESGSLEKGE